jgi:hypothetical protein
MMDAGASTSSLDPLQLRRLAFSVSVDPTERWQQRHSPLFQAVRLLDVLHQARCLLHEESDASSISACDA